MSLTWHETLYPNSPAPLAEVAARLADGIGRRGVLGPPLAFGDRPTAVTADGLSVRFGETAFGPLTNGAVVLSGSPEAVTAECSVGLPSGPVFLLVLALVVGLGSAVRGVVFDGEVALLLCWLLGGWYVFLRVGLRFRLLDLLKESVSGNPARAV